MNFVINGIGWQIKYVPKGSRFLLRSDGSSTLGVTDWNVKTVYLLDTLKGELLEHVLCHELCHCICFSHGIYLDIETEEWLCNFMADYGKETIYLLDNLLYFIGEKIA